MNKQFIESVKDAQKIALSNYFSKFLGYHDNNIAGVIRFNNEDICYILYNSLNKPDVDYAYVYDYLSGDELAKCEAHYIEIRNKKVDYELINNEMLRFIFQHFNLNFNCFLNQYVEDNVNTAFAGPTEIYCKRVNGTWRLSVNGLTLYFNSLHNIILFLKYILEEK